MNSFPRSVALLSALLFIACATEGASADVIVNITEGRGGAVIATISGSLSNLGTSSSQFIAAAAGGTTRLEYFTAEGNAFYLGSAVEESNVPINVYSAQTSSGGWNIGDPFTKTANASTFSGFIQMSLFENGFFLNNTYAWGTQVSGAATWNNTDLTGLGLKTGTYVWTVGSGANTDTITFNITSQASTAVPEPGSMAIAGLIVSGAAIRRWRGKRKAVVI